MPPNYSDNWQNKIFSVQTSEEFNALSIEIFQYQAANNPVYKKYIELLKININKISKPEEIPFLPIDFFKTHEIKTGDFVPQEVFLSSGTTGQIQSKHFVREISAYEKSFQLCFNRFYKEENQYCILALLPSYMQREGSSLIYMVHALINNSNNKNSGFFLSDTSRLIDILNENELSQTPTLLLGVTYALLDIIEKNKLNLNHTIVMETGGMKGRRKEIVREELHQILCEGFGVQTIHSEYGMTEQIGRAHV